MLETDSTPPTLAMYKRHSQALRTQRATPSVTDMGMCQRPAAHNTRSATVAFKLCQTHPCHLATGPTHSSQALPLHNRSSMDAVTTGVVNDAMRPSSPNLYAKGQLRLKASNRSLTVGFAQGVRRVPPLVVLPDVPPSSPGSLGRHAIFKGWGQH